jgi:hypothetical protein
MAVTDIASRTYDHGWRLAPLVRDQANSTDRFAPIVLKNSTVEAEGDR